MRGGLVINFFLIPEIFSTSTTTHNINCFIGKNVVITDSLPKEWIHASWRKSGVEMNPTVGVINNIGPFLNFDQSKFKILNDGNSLEIKSCDFGDAGEYRLNYATRSGLILSENSYNLSIYRKPDAPIMKKKGNWLKKGLVYETDEKEVLASCQTKSLPRAEHIWTDQDGVKYSSKEKVSGLRNDTVVSQLFVRVNRNLKGKRFSCKAIYKLAENGEQFRSEIVTALNVYFEPDPPVIRLDNNRTKLICQSEANPKAKIKWVVYKKGEGVKNNTVTAEVNSSELMLDSNVIKNLKKSIGNSSYLSCEAKNKVGFSERRQNVPDLISLTGGGNPITQIIKKAKAWTETQSNQTLILVKCV